MDDFAHGPQVAEEKRSRDAGHHPRTLHSSRFARFRSAPRCSCLRDGSEAQHRPSTPCYPCTLSPEGYLTCRDVYLLLVPPPPFHQNSITDHTYFYQACLPKQKVPLKTRSPSLPPSSGDESAPNPQRPIMSSLASAVQPLPVEPVQAQPELRRSARAAATAAAASLAADASASAWARAAIGGGGRGASKSKSTGPSGTSRFFAV